MLGAFIWLTCGAVFGVCIMCLMNMSGKQSRMEEIAEMLHNNPYCGEHMNNDESWDHFFKFGKPSNK